MKWNKILPYIIFVQAVLAGCSSEDVETAVGVHLMLTSVQVGGNGALSRGVYSGGGTLTSGSIGIYVYGTGYSYSNVQYDYGSTSWTPDSKAIYLTGKSATLVAYGPYSSTTNIASVSMAAGAYAETADLCMQRLTGISSTNPSTSFTFGHAYSRLTLSINISQSGTVSISNISISGPAIYSSATANLSGASTVISGQTTGTISINPGITSLTVGTPVTEDFLMIPAATSAFTGSTTISFTVNGTVQSVTLPVATPASGGLNALAAGTNYTISVLIQPTSVTLNSVTVNSWTVVTNNEGNMGGS